MKAGHALGFCIDGGGRSSIMDFAFVYPTVEIWMVECRRNGSQVGVKEKGYEEIQ